MLLKDIPVNSHVHCKTEDEARDLLEALDGLGYVWYPKKYHTKLTSMTMFEKYGQDCVITSGINPREILKLRKQTYMTYAYMMR